MDEEKKSAPATWRVRLRNYLLTGLLVVVPLAAAMYVLRIVLDIADATLQWLPQSVRPEKLLHIRIPGLFGLILTFLLLVLIGFLARNYFGQRLVRFYESILNRIPVIGSVYSAAKQLTTAIFSSDEQRFSRVVLVEFPRVGMHSVAFVTAEDAGRLAQPHDKPCCAVFVPTAPNPTSGYFLIVPRDQTIATDLTVDEAFRMIVSAGMVEPERRPAAPAPAADAAKD
jgi:uncharacterized membrane protein